MKERLQKVLARAGVSSRRAAEEIILEGRVTVNGAMVSILGTTVDAQTDRILIDGRPLNLPDATRVLMLNKPAGYVSTSRTSREVGESVLELVPKDRRYFSVGRLDADSTGLLLMTDDGDLAYRLTHPRHGTRKHYRVETFRRLTDDDLVALRVGVALEDGLARAQTVRRGAGNTFHIVLAEGRKRQIRRMISALGHRVRALHRTQIGPLKLGDLPLGHWRPLTEEEISVLRRPAAAGSRGSAK